MRAIVTGGLGFIGHNLIIRLLTEGWDVVCIDNLLTGDRDRALKFGQIKTGSYTPYIGAVNSFIGDHLQIPRRFDVVFHLAALPRVPVSFENPQLSLINNINSTIDALEIARKTGARFVYSSSSSIYGTQEHMPISEYNPHHPESPYAESKWIGEELCEQYHRSFGIDYVALRYFNVYGPGMTKGGYATAISTFLEQHASGLPLTITGDGTQERDFTHVDDVVNANILAAEHLLEGRNGPQEICGAYNIGAGCPRSILDVAKLISDNIAFIPARREPKKTHASSKKAEAILGWKPKAVFEEKIKELLS